MLVTYGGNKVPEVITCCHEEIAVAIEEGLRIAEEAAHQASLMMSSWGIGLLSLLC
jgi:hypothetical protein